MAHAPERHGRPALRLAAETLKAAPPPFVIDPSRLYEVAEDGRLHASAPVDPLREAVLVQRIRIFWYSSVALNALMMGATAIAFPLAGRGLAAAMGLGVFATVPLLGVAPLLEWRRLRARQQRADQRPDHFAPGM